MNKVIITITIFVALILFINNKGLKAANKSSINNYRVNAGKIYHNDQEIKLFGINWFGFETKSYVVGGLGLRNYKEVIAQIKSLGFNAIRIPFCPDILKPETTPNGIDYKLNLDLVNLSSLKVLDKLIEVLNKENIYILLDHHRPDSIAISELWYTDKYSEKQWLDDLIFLAKRYRDKPYFLGLDLKNEPHGKATWGTGNIATDWNKAAERAAKAVLKVNSSLLIFVEGIEIDNLCSFSSTWWGGNLGPQKCFPVNIPKDKLVLSPHVYGPDVYNKEYFNEPNFPDNMPDIWDKHFGYLVQLGYPLVMGEFGGKFGHGGLEKDIIWQKAVVDYLLAKGMNNFFYWALNPDSGDTGGLLQDDWKSIWQDKYDNLKRLMI